MVECRQEQGRAVQLAYKDIEGLIEAQSDLVEIIGIFTPRIVRMAEEAGEF